MPLLHFLFLSALPFVGLVAKNVLTALHIQCPSVQCLREDESHSSWTAPTHTAYEKRIQHMPGENSFDDRDALGPG